MDKTSLLNDLKKRMDGALASLDHDLKGVRTGRASANFLDSVVVEAYGDRMHLSQLATVTVPEARLINVQVWDKEMVKTVEKAIAHADLGVNPSADGTSIRVPLPILSQERRNELVKIAAKHGETCKISVRNVRRDGMDQLKKMEKDSEISKDDHHSISEEIQKVTEDYVKKIDSVVTLKEKDILNN
jgi:ribosome recycling factor